jgi:hypothetical protein
MDELDEPTAEDRNNNRILILNTAEMSFDATPQPGIMSRHYMLAERAGHGGGVGGAAAETIKVRNTFCSCRYCLLGEGEGCPLNDFMGPISCMPCKMLPPRPLSPYKLRILAYADFLGDALHRPLGNGETVIVGIRGGGLALVVQLPWKLAAPLKFTVNTRSPWWPSR